MNFQARIDHDLKEAMKAREAERLGVIRMLKSALTNVAIEKGGLHFVLDEATALAVVRKEMKKRQDSIESFEKGGRPELAAKEKSEAAILAAYLPQALSAEELTAVASSIQSRTFRSFEVYLAVLAIYLGLSLSVKGILYVISRRFIYPHLKMIRG